MAKWKIASAVMTGTSHLEENMPCQDFVRMRPTDEFMCVVMTDGAGSAKYSAESARLVAEETRNILLSRSTSLFDFNDEEIKNFIYDSLSVKLQHKASELSTSLYELACTLLFFVSDGKRFISLNIGDGIIGSINKEGVGATILEQERGKYANMSYFLTSSKSEEHIRVKQGSLVPDNVYFLMTDGAASCLFDTKRKQYANALTLYSEWLRKYNYQQVSKSIESSMYK